MNGLEQVKRAVAAALERAGVRAVTAWEPEVLKRYDGAVVAVGVRRCVCEQAGLWDYLGEETAAGGGSREVYGRRLELTLSLDAWADASVGALACQAALERACEALAAGLPAGLKAGEMAWEAVEWDGETGMFLRRGTLRCSAVLLAKAQAETGELTDFILKGVLTE